MSWPTVRLGEVCEFKYGKSLPAGKRDGGDFPVFGSNGIVGGHSKPLTSGPTIVIGRKGSFGEVAYSSEPCWPIDTTYYVDSSCTDTDLKWLSYRLGGLGLTSLNRAAAVPGLNREDAYRQELRLPPLVEQRRIAAILDQADQGRAKSATLSALLDELDWSFFGELLSAGEWPRETLESVTRAVFDCPHSTPKWAEEGEVCLRTSNLTRGGWDWSDTRYVSPQDYVTRSRRGEIEPGDIILSREGTVGIAAVVEPGMRVCMGQRLVQVRVDERRLTPGFLLHHLLFALAPERISHVMVGSTARHLNVKELRELAVPVPPLSLQAEFSQRIGATREARNRLTKSVEKNFELINSLRSRAFSGQL